LIEEQRVMAHALHNASAPILDERVMIMKRTQLTTTLALLLASATVVGCAADAPGNDDGDDMGDPMPQPDPQPVPLTPQGKFAVQSDFDLATNLPGTAGTVVNYFIQATDEPDDPTKFLLEQLIGALPNGQIKDALQGSIPFVSGYLNDRLQEVAPTFVTKIIDVGNGLGQVAHHFGTIEVLDISASQAPATGGDPSLGFAATKTIQGLHFNVDSVDIDLKFSDYGIQDVKVDGLSVSLETTGKLNISQHKVPLKFGAMMKLAMNEVIIPFIDPSVTDLEGLLKKAVNCQKVGQYVYDAIDLGSPSTFESACNAGLHAASTAFYRALDNIDTAALEFNLLGTARGIDKNHDTKMDDIQTGVWTGDVSYAGAPAPLSTAKFFGSAM
jgi:hypothetical protein